MHHSLHIQFVAFNTGLVSHQQNFKVTPGQINKFVKLYTLGSQVSLEQTIHVHSAQVHHIFNVANIQSAQEVFHLDI